MEISLGPIFEKLNNQEIQELQKKVVKHARTFQNMLESMDMEFMLRFYRSQEVQLDIVRCAYEEDPSCRLDLAHITCAVNILDNLINMKRNTSFGDDEEVDPKSLQVTQERMDEYSRSCREVVREYNSSEVFSCLYDEEVKLHKMKCEYKENPTNALLLEAYYQNHVTNILTIVLQEKREEERSRLSTNQDEDGLEDLSDEQEDDSSSRLRGG